MHDHCSVVCANALTVDYSLGTVFYLYLVPRGLRMILPILKALKKPIQVATYMSPFPESEKPVKVLRCRTSSHSDAMWPVYIYFING